MFFGGNLVMSFVTVPALLLQSPSSPLPAPANSENKSSPTSTSTAKAVTSASHLARQWQHVYDLGSKGGPFFALVACGSWLYTARRLPPGANLKQRLLLAAAGLSMSIVPFTFTAMKRTNGELHRRAGAATKGEDDETNTDAPAGSVETYQTQDLLRWWAQLNMMRASLHLGAIGCAVAVLTM